MQHDIKLASHSALSLAPYLEICASAPKCVLCYELSNSLCHYAAEAAEAPSRYWTGFLSLWRGNLANCIRCTGSLVRLAHVLKLAAEYFAEQINYAAGRQGLSPNLCLLS